MPTLTTYTASNLALEKALLSLSGLDSDYWSFKKQACRYGVHGLFQYPAMMVPKMQGDVLDAVIGANTNIETVWDPFMGAGTTMVESIARGLKFTGFDINPLATLICQAKSAVFLSDEFEDKAHSIISRYNNDKKVTIDISFPGRSKWFTDECSVGLSRIRRAIQKEPCQWARKIMWVLFAETIRKVSNSRTSTYKLHLRLPDDIRKIQPPINIFSDKLFDAVHRIAYHESLLKSNGLLKKGKYLRGVSIHCADVKTLSDDVGGKYDLMMTSPPYGDNRSTVSYGQFSYLALRWIPEIDLPCDGKIFGTAYATDTASLGGRNKNAKSKATAMCSASKTFNKYYKSLGKVDDRCVLMAKVASFVFDFFEALNIIVERMNHGGILVWTIGDRTVGGLPVPFVEICKELQESLGLVHISSVCRKIPTKRAPTRNSISNTIGTECLLVMRRN